MTLDKIKTYEADLKKDWEKREYLLARQELCKLTGEVYSPFIFCKCGKAIETAMVHVVEFGKSVACGTCYGKRWSKLKNRKVKFAVPQELAEDFHDKDDVPPPDNP